MSLLERIKATIFGEAPPPPPRGVDEDNNEVWASMRSTGRSNTLDVSTPADDPAMDDIAAGGVQPTSKPEEIEEAQNPRCRPVARSN